MRNFWAVISGVIAGLLISGSMEKGVAFNFLEEYPSDQWGLAWGEHWILRTLVSCIATILSGFITGIIGSKRGKLLATLSAIPSFIIWMMATILTWGIPLFGTKLGIYVSILGKLAAPFIALATLPLAAIGGFAGETLVGKYNLAAHFDSRRHTLLGMSWYHYFWFPIIANLVLIQTTWAFLHGVELWKGLWIGGSILLLTIFAGSSFLSIYGLAMCFAILAGLEPSSPGHHKLVIIKYGFGFPACSIAFQTGILWLHDFLIK